MAPAPQRSLRLLVVGALGGLKNPVDAVSLLAGGLIGAGVESLTTGTPTFGRGYLIGSFIGGIVGRPVDAVAIEAEIEHALDRAFDGTAADPQGRAKPPRAFSPTA